MERKLGYHLFFTCDKYYVYDLNKHIVLNIDKNTFNALDEAQKKNDKYILCNNEITSSLMEEGYFDYNKISKIEHPATNILHDVLNYNLFMLILQVTQNCNLRCKYCVYSGSYLNRVHNNKRMSFETAKKAIDYYIQHSSMTQELRIGFYGGEPLLEFDLIKKCVEYIETCSIAKPVYYNITTNATVLNKGMIDFLIEKKFRINISLDGPEEIQNKNRIFASSGKGTFNSVFEKIETLKHDYSNSIISISAVLDPVDAYKLSSDFFKFNPLLKSIQVSATEKSGMNYKDALEQNEQYNINSSYDKFTSILNKMKLYDCEASPLALSYFNRIKSSCFDSLGTANSIEKAHPSGPCLPGGRRLFANADGVFYPCERINETSEVCKIGNIDVGVDIEKAKQLLNIGQITEETCLNCWAFHFCVVCVAMCEDGDHLSAEKKLSRCNSVRYTSEVFLKEYCILKSLKFNFEDLESYEEFLI